MAQVTFRKCDVYGGTRDVELIRVTINVDPDQLRLPGIPDGLPRTWERDLCRRAVRRLVRFIDRGMGVVKRGNGTGTCPSTSGTIGSVGTIGDGTQSGSGQSGDGIASGCAEVVGKPSETDPCDHGDDDVPRDPPTTEHNASPRKLRTRVTRTRKPKNKAAV